MNSPLDSPSQHPRILQICVAKAQVSKIEHDVEDAIMQKARREQSVCLPTIHQENVHPKVSPGRKHPRDKHLQCS